MLLVVDVGNTNTVIGLMEGEVVRAKLRLNTVDRTTDELGIVLLAGLQHRGVGRGDVTGAIVSSVVPSALYAFEKACQRYLGVDTMIVGRGLKTRLKIRVDNPREVGADRIVNSVAALQRWGGPIVVVDFGTATTFDCVSAEGEYVGGAIAPGFRISEEALVGRTAKLPRVEVRRPPRVIGTNTQDAMQAGMFYGYVGLVDALASRCAAELGGAKVVATGGLSGMLGEESAVIEEVDPDLTLRGLALLFGYNQET